MVLVRSPVSSFNHASKYQAWPHSQSLGTLHFLPIFSFPVWSPPTSSPFHSAFYQYQLRTSSLVLFPRRCTCVLETVFIGNVIWYSVIYESPKVSFDGWRIFLLCGGRVIETWYCGKGAVIVPGSVLAPAGSTYGPSKKGLLKCTLRARCSRFADERKSKQCFTVRLDDPFHSGSGRWFPVSRSQLTSSFQGFHWTPMFAYRPLFMFFAYNQIKTLDGSAGSSVL